MVMTWAGLEEAAVTAPATAQQDKANRKPLNDFGPWVDLPFSAETDLFMGSSHGCYFQHCPNNSSVQAQWSNLL
jgi:hypothetical protein